MPTPFLCRSWTDSRRVNSLDACAERFFMRLMMKCDDYGIHPADVLLLKSSLFPLLPRITHTDIARWLAECEQADLVRCYHAANAERYVQVLHFGQKRKYMKSAHPPPEGQMPLLTAEAQKPPPRSRSRSRKEVEERNTRAGEPDRERPSCPPASPVNGESKAGNIGTPNPVNYAPPVAKLRREMWQLLSDEKAMSERIAEEIKKQQPDKDLIVALKSRRVIIREEMKSVGG